MPLLKNQDMRPVFLCRLQSPFRTPWPGGHKRSRSSNLSWPREVLPVFHTLLPSTISARKILLPRKGWHRPVGPGEFGEDTNNNLYYFIDIFMFSQINSAECLKLEPDNPRARICGIKEWNSQEMGKYRKVEKSPHVLCSTHLSRTLPMSSNFQPKPIFFTLHWLPLFFLCPTYLSFLGR